MRHQPTASRFPDIWLTAHGRTRCRQRGTPYRTLAALLDWADVEVPVGSGGVALSISTDAEAEMRGEGLAPELVRHARRRAAVQAGGRIITVVVGSSLRARRYRRRMSDRTRPRAVRP